MSDNQTAASEEYEWVTVVKDKRPNETWRQYARRAAGHWGLVADVIAEYEANVQRGIKPRAAALEALEMFHCADEDNREVIRVYRSSAKWVERPRLVKLHNALLEFLEGSISFTPYKQSGKSHTEVVIDDSEVLALLLICSVIADGKIPKKMKEIAKEGHRAATMLRMRRRAVTPPPHVIVDSQDQTHD